MAKIAPSTMTGRDNTSHFVATNEGNLADVMRLLPMYACHPEKFCFWHFFEKKQKNYNFAFLKININNLFQTK